ncbi:MAG: S41 family peptidase [Planctomycetes bacterium]|nr:S41 family peptidase [Planctomycetota bacterium]
MQQQPRLPLWFLVANWALVVAAFVLGVVLGGRHRIDLPEPQSTALQLVFAEVLKSHVDSHDGNDLLDAAIDGMVRSLDPYSDYVPPREVRAYDERNSGHYEGVGLLMTPQGEDVVVQYPFPGGPAARAGVLPGDVILAVDGKLLADEPAALRNEVALKLVRGDAGTEVRLRLRRDAETLELAMQRGDVQKSAVKWVHLADADAGLGYVYLSDFHPGIAAQVTAAVDDLQRQRPLRGLVLDLRFDGGGNLDECVALANAFLPGGTIVSQRRRDRVVVETFVADPAKCRFPDLPLVVLVNEHSASASEVLAGALQDHDRAAIVGVRTYGKGYVNTVYTWKNLDFRLKLTTAHYYTPDGRNLDGHHHGAADAPANGAVPAAPTGGIEPDVAAPVTTEQLRATARTLTNHEPPAVYLPAFRTVALRYGIEVPVPPAAATDPQLAQALATLRDRIAAAGR